MKQLLFLFLFYSPGSFAQPGRQEVTFNSTIKYLVVDRSGDTITPLNIQEKNFTIYSYYGTGKNTNYQFDSTGIIQHSDSITINLFGSNSRLGYWDKDGWVISINHDGKNMTIYASGTHLLHEDHYNSAVYVIYFEPGNYFAMKNLLYYKNGQPITHYLISLDETQSEEWEEVFDQYHIREKVGIKQ